MIGCAMFLVASSIMEEDDKADTRSDTRSWLNNLPSKYGYLRSWLNYLHSKIRLLSQQLPPLAQMGQ